MSWSLYLFLPTSCRQILQHLMAPASISRYKLRLVVKLDDMLCYLGEWGGTLRLGLLISRFQVRVLGGSRSNPSLFTNIFANELVTTIKEKVVPSGTT